MGRDRPLFEFGHDADEEDHADEDEADDDKHGPEEPVDGLLCVLLQPLRLGLQLLQVLVGHLEGVRQGLWGRQGECQQDSSRVWPLPATWGQVDSLGPC